jgi:hypothetical protein
MMGFPALIFMPAKNHLFTFGCLAVGSPSWPGVWCGSHLNAWRNDEKVVLQADENREKAFPGFPVLFGRNLPLNVIVGHPTVSWE